MAQLAEPCIIIFIVAIRTGSLALLGVVEEVVAIGAASIGGAVVPQAEAGHTWEFAVLAPVVVPDGDVLAIGAAGVADVFLQHLVVGGAIIRVIPTGEAVGDIGPVATGTPICAVHAG